MSLTQVNVPASRLIVVKSRDSDEFGVIGEVNMLPGETLVWALEFKGTELPPGWNLYGMSSPAIGGADLADMTVEDYGVTGTQAKFELSVDSGASEGADITLSITVQPQASETMIVSVPVTIGS